MATKFATAFGAEKKARKGVGEGISNIPGVNHPVFKNQLVNNDPREVYLSQLFTERGETNVFHDFYSAVVQALYDNGVTANVFCVNIDAVIAALLLKLLVAALPFGRILSERAGERGVHSLPVRTDGRLRGRDRRSHQPRPQHGYPDSCIPVHVRFLMDKAGRFMMDNSRPKPTE